MAKRETIKENKMGVMPINKLIVSISLPIMISMLIQALYNVVDSIFVAKISENALTAVSLAFPIQNLMIAIGTGTGVGINAYLSKSLGEGNKKEASKAANNGLFLALISYVAFFIFGLFFVKPFYELQTNNAEIIELGSTYLSICSFLSIGLFGQITLERLLQSTGKTLYTMVTQGTGAIINLIFDPILIFGLFGMPALGVKGAAMATIFGQIVSMCLAVFFNIKINKDITLSFKNFKPDFKAIKRIYSIGIPSIIMVSIASVMTFLLNKILLTFSSTATAVFGIYFKLQSFVFMPIFGLNNGLIPIISYNYGANKGERMEKAIKLSIIYAVSIMLIGLFIFQVFPRQLLSFFNASEEMIAIGIVALKRISISFLFAGFCIITVSVFQALGYGVSSLIVTVSRQLIVLVPMAYLLSKTGNIDNIWYAFPIAEVVSVTLSFIFMKKLYNEVLKPLKNDFC